jgi:hypothetical protein
MDISPKVNLIRNSPNVREVSERLEGVDVMEFIRYLILENDKLRKELEDFKAEFPDVESVK